ncbi:MAG: hypothetical protein ABI460_19185, partial [Caldimonas sp.]
MSDTLLFAGLALLLVVAVFSVRWLAMLDEQSAVGRFGTPLLFGLWVLAFWQILVQAFDVPQVLLPAPTLVAHALYVSFGVLVSDFEQTVLHSVLIGLV